MNHSSLILKGRQLKLNYCFILLFLICCEMLFPFQGWAQSFQDTGSFTFTGSHNPLRRPLLREFLPGKGLKAGPVQIHTFLGVAEVFTDNVFRTNKQRRSDFLTTIAPGIQAKLPFGGQHSFLLDYRAAQFLYAKNNENNVFAQHGIGQLSLKFPGRLKIDLHGGPVEGFDPRGSALDIQTRDITKWRATTFLGQASLRGRLAGIQLRSRYVRWHFKNNGQDASRDRKNLKVDLTGSLNATQASSVLLGVNIANNTFDENKQLDSFTYGVFGGFEIAPSRLLSGEVRVGYSILNFDRAPISPDLSVPPDPTNPATILTAQGLSLGGDRQKALTIDGLMQWRPTSNLNVTVSPFRRIQQIAVFNTSTVIQSGVGLSLSQALKERLAIVGSFFYSNDDFSGDRKDDRFLWRAGLDYRTVEWLGFRLAYIFERRYSTQDTFDSYSNTISLSVQALL